MKTSPSRMLSLLLAAVLAVPAAFGMGDSKSEQPLATSSERAPEAAAEVEPSAAPAAAEAPAAAPTAASAKVGPDTAAAAREAAAKAAAWLAAAQQPDGHWGMAETPALTALAMWALQRTDPATYADQIAAAAAFVLQNAQPDGSIFFPPRPGVRGGGLANYNTAICLSALHSLPNALTDPAILRAMQNARAYLAGTQYLDEGLFRGGIGYDPEQPTPHADLSNSHMVYEAMHLTEDIEDLRAEGEKRADLDWDAALDFLAQVQNLPEVNTNAWVSSQPDDLGGFIYRPAAVGAAERRGGPGAHRGPPPGAQDAAATPASPRFPRLPEGASGVGTEAHPGTRPAGSVAVAGPAGGHPVEVHPYGSMTYAGLLSLIYAHLGPDDPRVQAARAWTQRHWTLAENPGMGPEGLYYFFNTLSKCMAAMGDETVTRPDGTTVPWRDDLLERLVALQRPDASWCNDNNRWWEADPALVTSYTLLAIASALD